MALLHSKIILCKGVKMDRNYTNVLNYSLNDMLTLVNSTGIYLDHREYYSFIRQSEIINADFSYSDAVIANYIAFQNPDYSNKWFFAWIDDIEYKGERNVNIKFTIDQWSTWFSDLTLNPVMVEREHVNDDTAFLHTIPEPVTCDDYDEFNDEAYIFHNWKPHFHYFYDDPDATDQSQQVGYRLESLYMNPLDVMWYDITDKGLKSLHNDFKALAGDKEAIVGVTLFPGELTTPGVEVTMEGVGTNRYVPSSPTQSVTIKTFNYNLADRPGEGFSINGYVPINNKMFTYPYCYIDVDDGHNHVELRNEYFRQPFNGVDFSIVGYDLTPQMEISFYPKNYHGRTNNPQYALTISDLPQIPVPIDSYKAWLAQKSNSQILAMFGAGLTGAVSGGVSGGPIGALIGAGVGLTGGAISYVTHLQAAKDASDSIKGNSSSSNNLFMNQIGFHVKQVGLKKDAAESIDNFFSRFGYMVNIVKVPNITGRTYWNYVKINGICGHGPIPERSRNTINDIMNTGVTIWHNHSYLGNYLIGGNKMENPIV